MIVSNVIISNDTIIRLSEYQKLRFAFYTNLGICYVIETDNEKIKEAIEYSQMLERNYKQDNELELVKEMQDKIDRLVSILLAYKDNCTAESLMR